MCLDMRSLFYCQFFCGPCCLRAQRLPGVCVAVLSLDNSYLHLETVLAVPMGLLLVRAASSKKARVSSLDRDLGHSHI